MLTKGAEAPDSPWLDMGSIYPAPSFRKRFRSVRQRWQYQRLVIARIAFRAGEIFASPGIGQLPVYAILMSVGVSTVVVATVTLFSTMLITVSVPAFAR